MFPAKQFCLDQNSFHSMSPAAMTAKEQSNPSQINGNEKSMEFAEFEKLLSESAKRTRELFSTAYSQAVMDEQARFAFRQQFSTDR